MIERRRLIIQKTQEPVLPLTFTALANSSRVSVNVHKSVTGVSYFEVSKNGGAWLRYNKSNRTALSFAILLSAGDYCLIRGLNIALNGGSYRTKITLEGNIEVSGNIATLYHPKGILPSLLLNYGYAFYYLFLDSTGLTSAENLILPQPVGERCYSLLFSGCSYLTIGPTIPDFTVTQEYGLNGMFSGCARLALVTVLLSQQPSLTYTYNWLNGVSYNGTFIKNPSATWDRVGASGVPTNWTIIDYQE